MIYNNGQMWEGLEQITGDAAAANVNNGSGNTDDGERTE